MPCELLRITMVDHHKSIDKRETENKLILHILYHWDWWDSWYLRYMRVSVILCISEKWFEFYYEQCIGTKWAHTLWISSWDMRNYTWNKGKMLPKICEIPQLRTCKVTSCEKPSMNVKKQELSYFRNTEVFHLNMHVYFDKSMDSDLNYYVFCCILFILS